MKGILGNILDAKTLQAMEVCAAMAAAGASQVACHKFYKIVQRVRDILMF